MSELSEPEVMQLFADAIGQSKGMQSVVVVTTTNKSRFAMDIVNMEGPETMVGTMSVKLDSFEILNLPEGAGAARLAAMADNWLELHTKDKNTFLVMSRIVERIGEDFLRVRFGVGAREDAKPRIVQ